MNGELRVRVTKSMKERILNMAEAEGYKTYSQFVREKLLKEDLATRRMIKEIHEKIVERDIKKK